GDGLGDRLEDGEEAREVRGCFFTSLKRLRRHRRGSLRWRFRLVYWPGGATRRQHLRQGPPLDQLHREERPAVGEGAQLVDRHDPRVLKLPADLRLLDEPAD